MEHSIKLERHNLMSELILDILKRLHQLKCQGLIHPDNLRSLAFRKLWVH